MNVERAGRQALYHVEVAMVLKIAVAAVIAILQEIASMISAIWVGLAALSWLFIALAMFRDTDRRFRYVEEANGRYGSVQ